jgi:hypothetical protein
MSSNNIHDEWLSLVEVTGPFLAPPVLNEAFPQGLDLLDPGKRKRLRQTYEEWREALDSEDPEFLKLHQAWINEVISNCLGFNQDGKGAHLKFGAEIPSALIVQIAEQGITLSPEYVLVDEQQNNKPLLLVRSYASGVDLQAVTNIDGWSATPADRMIQLCRSTGCRLGLITDGERWMLVDAPMGAVTTFASWYARLWIQEPITLQAFVHLLGIRRFFVAADHQITALIDKSLQYQDDVTTALGEQVQRAVEVLIQSLDRADLDRNRDLLKDVTPTELYEAGLTVMMRLVFLLSAEERGLLLMGDECYEDNYAISTLRMQLRNEPEEILERRWDAWSRLLSIFRVIYGGVDHENMRLPALGGSLFDPDRFPFLEGRTKGADWRNESAKPLPIDNRTVLLLLDAIQQYQGRALSYRALDVEQIGYVYEGLLERTVKRSSEVILDIGATRSAENPLASLAELEELKQSNQSLLIDFLVKKTGSSLARVKNELAKPIDEKLSERLLTSCLGNVELRNQIKPYANLLRIDPWGYPLVYPAGSFLVASGSERKETGSHYTPKSLTEKVVANTLTPLVFNGPSEGVPREEWRLKGSKDILALKICDPAMGSGAFLVEACRWLSSLLVEAWAIEEEAGYSIGEVGELIPAESTLKPSSFNPNERIILARNLIAERCLYGVDINPLAVELAKLSIWLVTLAKGKPFGFLNHNLKCGDSILGTANLEQVTELKLNNSGEIQNRLFGQNIKNDVNKSVVIREQVRSLPIRDIKDVEFASTLNNESRECIKLSELIGDSLIAEVLAHSEDSLENEFNNAIISLSINAEKALQNDFSAIKTLEARVTKCLSISSLGSATSGKPFHWALEFPEVFHSSNSGFDGIIGNPPFMGGRKIQSAFGFRYNAALKKMYTSSDGAIDLSVYFIRRAFDILGANGFMGLITTKSISETVNRDAGLSQIVSKGGIIYSAVKAIAWPGQAAVVVSLIYITKANWLGVLTLDSNNVAQITTSLTSDINLADAKRLKHQIDYSQGGLLFGSAFVRDVETIHHIRSKNPGIDQYLRTYVNGDVLNGTINSEGDSVVIDFGEREIKEITGCDLILEELISSVSKERSSQTRQIHETRPWLHWDKRTKFFQKARAEKFVIACARVSKFLIFSLVDSSKFFSDGLVVFATDRKTLFGILQSSIHECWVYGVSSKLGSINRYSTSVSFDTFPFNEEILSSHDLLTHASNYLEARQKVQQDFDIGLTALYRKIHSQSNSEDQILHLRKLRSELDYAVCRAYGWNDIKLNHAFISLESLPANDSTRYTISGEARLQILNRLLQMNLQMFELQSSGKPVKKGKVMTKLNPAAAQADLF